LLCLIGWCRRGGLIADRDRLRQRGLQLLYATVAWNAIEGGAALVAGIVAHSVALTAFGLDSSIEVFVSLVAVWQMKKQTKFRRRRGLQLIGTSFLLVAIYVAVEALGRLATAQHAELSIVGLAVASAAVPIMAVLGFAKRSIADRIGNAVLAAEAKFSLVDASLSAAVLLGLVLDQALGWWWADPAVALVIACAAAREGVDNLRSGPR
jgi:divalent metal cation (Fe/Co/Zn/Cd) transporter